MKYTVKPTTFHRKNIKQALMQMRSLSYLPLLSDGLYLPQFPLVLIKSNQ